MSKGTKKVGYKGPRVTGAVVSLDVAGRAAWLASLKVSDTERTAIAARLEKAVKAGPKVRKFNLDGTLAALQKQPVAVLAAIQKSIAPLIEAGRATAKAELAARIEADRVALAALEA